MKKTKGIQLFHEHFKEIYCDRWDTLFESLKKDSIKVARPLYHKVGSSIEEYLNSLKAANEENKEHAYVMDAASIIAPMLLNVTPQDKVLDMCAAPGGKALILLEHLQGAGSITLNDVSLTRKERLKRVITEHARLSDLELVTFTNFDADQFGIKKPQQYNKILLDAPCSGERHIIHDQQEMNLWTPTRSKKLSSRQYGLLCSALLACKTDGTIVYSTCSISPLENDLLIERLIEKKSAQFFVDKPNLTSLPQAEETKYGHIFLPDNGGFGPQYVCRLIKKDTSDE